MRVVVLIKATERSEAGEMPSQELLEQMTAYNDLRAAAGTPTGTHRIGVIRSTRSGKGEQWWEDDHHRGGPQGEDGKVGRLPALEPVGRAASCEESGG